MSGVYALKPRFVAALAGVEDRLVAHRVSPGVLSLASVGFAVAAGAALAVRWWPVVPLFAVGRLACNALDGSVARRTGASSRRGAVLNEVCDRIGDLVMLAPLAVVVPPFLVLLAVAVALATSWAGVLGQAVVGERLVGGPMGKADRVALLAVAAPVAWLVGGAAPLKWALWLIIIAGGLTVALRLRTLVTEVGSVQ